MISEDNIVICETCEGRYFATPKSPLHTRKECCGCNKARVDKLISKKGIDRLCSNCRKIVESKEYAEEIFLEIQKRIKRLESE